MKKKKKNNSPQPASNVRAEDSRIKSLADGVARLSIVGHSNPPKLSKANIVREFDKYFGDVSKLANWQRFCGDVGLDIDKLTSLSKCKQALRGVWINIYDFIDSQREGKIPRRFANERQLSVYTRETKKVYPKKMAKEGGPVSALLAHIF